MKPTSGTTLSVWAATTAEPGLSPLNKDASAHVCIIGAGIAGLTTAYLLAKEGKHVVLLDDGPMGGGMTARTTATPDERT
jgi:heterodisulfide reductase subunit A-like polyferredoxin